MFFCYGCPKCFQARQRNRHFWAEKIEPNRKRDRKVTRALRQDGVRVKRLWEHDLENRTWRIIRAFLGCWDQRPGTGFRFSLLRDLNEFGEIPHSAVS